ncbi:hypothetical protein BDV23DRAFT_162266 [Aspergillus alliaceus]|uniref:Uncharacterized protein n=1 Tax=Petromyces alliaceus TaxID=209559 RepID=A0A5N7BYM8_PETAA|nr:hypothetical protein BDV23DRAFT_162266 [Aspergillus alliaceus]
MAPPGAAKRWVFMLVVMPPRGPQDILGVVFLFPTDMEEVCLTLYGMLVMPQLLVSAFNAYTGPCAMALSWGWHLYKVSTLYRFGRCSNQTFSPAHTVESGHHSGTKPFTQALQYPYRTLCYGPFLEPVPACCRHSP